MVAFLRRVVRNWKLKTLAVALAVLLWVVVSAEQPTTNWQSVPLQVQLNDSNYRLDRSELPDEVEVRLSGRTRDLLDLAFFRKPPLVLQVSGVERPVETRALTPNMVQLPAQMQVSTIDVRPSALRLEFTRVGTKTVPVRPLVRSELGSDFAIVDTLQTEPAAVEISGALERLQEVTEVQTLPFDLTRADSIIDRTIALDTARLAGLELSHSAVRVVGRIDRIISRTLRDVPVDVGPGVMILPARVDVTLRGPASAVEAITPAAFRIVISIGQFPSRIPAGGVVVPLRIDRLRPGVTGLLSPGEVRLFPQPAAHDSVPTPPALTPGAEMPLDAEADVE